MRSDPDFERFNLRHLRYFLAVCESGSFRAASAKLHVAQSAVSRRVADLERMFDTRLLERCPRGVTLTEAGAALRRSALGISEEIDAAQAALRRYGRGETGTLSVGFFGTTVRLGFVPELIARFRTHHPQIRLDMHPLPHSETVEATLAALDAAFLETPLDRKERSTMLLRRGAYWIAMPHGHPLAGHAAVPFEELSRYDLIGIPQVANPQVYDRLIRLAARSGQPLNIIHENESECSRLAFAAAGMGLTLVSPLAINHEQDFQVEYRPIADAVLPFELWLSVKPAASIIIDALVALTRSVLADLPSLDS